MNVKISIIESKIVVSSPYHPDFPKYAKNLGGRFNGSDKTWSFDSRDEASVRDLCLDCFGTDGEIEPELVDVRVTLTGSASKSIWFAGREIARRPGRDMPVRLGSGVVVINGQFASSGGSRNYPCVSWIGDSIALEVRDVPISLAEREKEKDPENVEILASGGEFAKYIAVRISAKIMEKLQQVYPNLKSNNEVVETALKTALLESST